MYLIYRCISLGYEFTNEIESELEVVKEPLGHCLQVAGYE